MQQGLAVAIFDGENEGGEGAAAGAPHKLFQFAGAALAAPFAHFLDECLGVA